MGITKKVLGFLLLGALALNLVACGDNDDRFRNRFGYNGLYGGGVYNNPGTWNNGFNNGFNVNGFATDQNSRWCQQKYQRLYPNQVIVAIQAYTSSSQFNCAVYNNGSTGPYQTLQGRFF